MVRLFSGQKKKPLQLVGNYLLEGLKKEGGSYLPATGQNNVFSHYTPIYACLEQAASASCITNRASRQGLSRHKRGFIWFRLRAGI